MELTASAVQYVTWSGMEQAVFDASLTSKVQPRSCDRCYTRKSKCTRHLPCEACVSAGLQCSYKRTTHYQRRAKPGQRRRSQNPGSPRNPAGHIVQQFGVSLPHTPGVEEDADSRDWATFPLDEMVRVAMNDYSTPSFDCAITEDTLFASLGDVTQADSEPEKQDTAHSLLTHRNLEPGTVPATLAADPAEQHVVSPVPDLLPLGYPAPYTIESAPLAVQSACQGGDLCATASAEDEGRVIGTLIDIFLERIHPSMPFFKCSYLQHNTKVRRQDSDRAFNALIHAICAMTLLQSVQAPDDSLFPNRVQQAEALLARAVQLHSHADFGEAPVLENVLTSVFLFSCQFCRGNHNAARFRLREAISLAEIMQLGDLQTYGSLTADERDRRLRTLLCLTIIERVYAIQRGYPLSEKSLIKRNIPIIQDMIRQDYATYEPRDMRVISGLGHMLELIDFVDNRMLRCWRDQCWTDGGDARHVHPSTISSLLRRYSSPVTFPRGGGGGGGGRRWWDTQRADILITRHWIRHILWSLGFRHGFVEEGPGREAELCPGYAISIAADAIGTCESFSMGVLEVHGIGLTEKLYDIINGAVGVLQRRKDISSASASSTTQGLGTTGSGGNSSTHDSAALLRHGQSEVQASPFESAGADDAEDLAPPSFFSSTGCCDNDQQPVYGSPPADLLNRYLAVFAAFKGGKHPFLRPYVHKLCKLDAFAM